MRGRGIRVGTRAGVALLLVLVTLGWAAPAGALSIAPYTVAFQTNTNGAITQIGNTLMSCSTSDSTCAGARAGTGPNLNNNDFTNMTWVNADGSPGSNPPARSSSSATFTLPPGGQVLYAQLAWGARTVAGSGGANEIGNINQLKWKKPGDTGYTTITAPTVYGGNGSVQYGMYHAFVDVTAAVRAAGSGSYWGADVAAATGADRYAGWSLVVAFSDPARPLRNLTVYNGFSLIESGTAGESVTISGFLAPKAGTVSATVGVVAYEGDLGYTGDQMQLNGVALTDAVVPASNFFNSGESNVGVLFTARSPAYVNNLGYDVKSVAADGVLPNGATSAKVSLVTNGDTYAPGVITTTINLYSPSFPAVTKSVTDVTSGASTASIGDTLEYTINLPNTGGDGAANSVVTDVLPPNTSYVAGSLKYAQNSVGDPPPTFTPLTDGKDGDQGEVPAGTVTVRVGTGANATTGGLIPANGLPGNAVWVRFRVRVDTAAAGTTIANTDVLDYTLQTLGNPITRSGTPATIPVSPEADLGITKTGAPSPLPAGANVTYTLTVTNNGPNASTAVVAQDALPLALTFVSATPSVGGPCTFAAPRVTCPLGTLANGATATVAVVATLPASVTSTSGLNDVATVSAATDDPVPANNTASITTPVVQRADLAAGIAVTSPTPVVPGNPVTVQLTMTNTGPSDAANATLTANLGPLTGLALVSPVAGCTLTGTVVTCTRAALAALGSLTVSLTGTVPPATTGDSLPFAATVSTTTNDPNAANDTASKSVPLAAPSADVSVTKTASSPTATAGDGPYTYTLVVANAGPSTAAAVALADPIPGQVTLVDVSPSRGSCIQGATVTCAIGALAPGGSATVTVTVAPTATAAAGPFGNTGTVTSLTADPNTANNSATATVTMATAADVALVKTATPALAGTDVTFTLTATNNGPSYARSVTLTDPLPAGATPFTFVSVTNPSGTCSTHPAVGSNGTVTCGIGDLPPDGSTRAVTIVAHIPAGFTGTIDNVATADSPTTDPVQANNTATYAVAVGTQADLALTKNQTSPAPPAPIVGGSPVTWTILVTNRGPSNATDVVVTDTVNPAYVTLTGASATTTLGDPCEVTVGTGAVSCPVGTLANGAGATITITGTAVAKPPGSTLSNSATVTATTTDPTQSNNTDTALSTVVTRADLGATKTPSAPTVDAGGTVTYTLGFTNAGPSTAVTPKVVDVLPAGQTFVSASAPAGWACALIGVAVTCTDSADLASGGSGSITVTVRVDPGLATGATLTDTAVISSPTVDLNGANDSASATVTVTTHADLATTKTDVPASLVAGSTAVYQITVVNHGPSNAAAATLSDPLPAGVTYLDSSPTQGTCTLTGSTVDCALGVIPAGATVTVDVTVTVDPAATGPISNTATAGSATPDPVPGNNAGSVTSEVSQQADVRIVKSASPTAVSAGGVVDYTLTVTNSGPSQAADVVASDTIVAGFTAIPANSSPQCTLAAAPWTCPAGTLAPGQSTTFVIEVRADPGLGAGSYPNTATVASTTTDPNLANNTSTVTLPVTRDADLSVNKNADSSIPAAGTNFGYAFVVQNSGPSDAPAVVVHDTLPAVLTFVSSPDGCTAAGQDVSCSAGGIPVAGQRTFHALVHLAASAPPGLLDNTATVSSAVNDPNPADNTSTATVTVQQSADLSIAKALTSGPVVAGRDVTWTITVTNQGPSDAGTFTVDDTLPDGLGYVSASVPGGTCTVTGANVVCTAPSLAFSASTVLTLSATTPPTLAGDLANTAHVTGSTLDPVPTNDASTATNPVTASADVSVTKTAAQGSFTAGGPVSWTITVTNAGPSDAQQVTVTDPVPAGVQGVTVTSTPAGVCSQLPCTVGSLAAGASLVLTVSGTLDPAFSGTPLANTASAASASTPDPNGGDNSATATSEVTTSADVSVTKQGPPTTAAGRPITWTVTVVNHGPSVARSVLAEDSVPTDVTVVNATWPAGTCQVSATAVACELGDLPPATTVVVTVTGTVAASAPLGPLTNTVAVTSSTHDPNGDDNSAASTTNVVPQADLTLVKTTAPDPVVAGGPLTWTLTVHNAGPSDAADVVVADPVPAGVTVTSATWPAGSCTLGPPLACPLHVVPAGGSVTVTVHGTLDPGFTGGSLSNTASVTASTYDPNPDDDTATSTVPVQDVAPLTLVKHAGSASVVAGGTVTYTIVVANAGPSTARTVTVTDATPAGVSASSASAPGGSCTVGDTVVCTVPAIPPGASVTVTVVATVSRSVPAGPVTNTATATAANTPGVHNPPGSATVTVVAPPPGPTPSPTTPPVVPPLTGTDTGRQALLAMGLLAAGLLITLGVRRRVSGTEAAGDRRPPRHR